VNKNLMPAYQTIDQMTNRTQLYQVLDQIVNNRADQAGNPSPQNQAGLFNQLVDMSAVSMVRDQTQKQQQSGGGGGGVGGAAAFTPAAARSLIASSGMNQQQIQTFITTIRQAAGNMTLASTGNAAVDSLLTALGFTIT
jgi:hypothetical protein